MANRLRLAEQVIRILKGYKPTDDRHIDVREVAIAIDQRRDQAIWEAALQRLNLEGEGWVLGDFVTTYTSPLIWDKKRNAHVLNLQYDVFSLPHDKGVWFIGFDDDNAFLPMRNGFTSLISGSRTEAVLKTLRPRYFVEGGTVYIKGLDDGEACDVLVKQIAVSGSLEDDYYAMPSGFEFAVVADVLRVYGVSVAPDDINNDLDGR